MSVYVDRMRAKKGRLIMCHMMADTPEELHAMADKIGLKRKWAHGEGYRLHYNPCLSYRQRAIEHGAIEVSQHELGLLLRKWRAAQLQRERTASADS